MEKLHGGYIGSVRLEMAQILPQLDHFRSSEKMSEVATANKQVV